MKLRNTKLPIYTVLTLFVLNVLIKSIGLITNCISLDEPYSIFYAQMNIKDIVGELLKGNNPFLWEVILHFWIKLFGTGSGSVRFLPMLFSSFTAIYVFLIGRRFFSYKIGLVAALLFSFSNYHLFFSHEARVYPLFCLMATMSMYYFLAFLKDTKQWRYFTAFTVCNILMCYGHYFGFFLLFMQFIYALLYLKVNKQVLYSFLLSMLIFIIAYLPILMVFFSRLYVSVSKGTWLSPVSGDSWFFLLASWVNNRVNLLFFLALLLVSLVLLVRQLIRNYQRNLTLLIIFSWFWVPFLLMYFISFRVPMFLDRYLIYMSPAFFLIIPLSIRMLRLKNMYQKVGFAIFLAMMIVSFRFHVSNERDMDRLVDKAKELQRNAKTEIYFSPPWFDLNFMYYYDRQLFNQPYAFHQSLDKNLIYPIYNSEGIHPATLAQKTSLVYIDFNARFVFPDNTILATLRKIYNGCDSTVFLAGFTVYQFYSR